MSISAGSPVSAVPVSIIVIVTVDFMQPTLENASDAAELIPLRPFNDATEFETYCLQNVSRETMMGLVSYLISPIIL